MYLSHSRGIDYMVEAKLAEGRAQEAEQKVQGTVCVHDHNVAVQFARSLAGCLISISSCLWSAHEHVSHQLQLSALYST